MIAMSRQTTSKLLAAAAAVACILLVFTIHHDDTKQPVQDAAEPSDQVAKPVIQRVAIAENKVMSPPQFAEEVVKVLLPPGPAATRTVNCNQGAVSAMEYSPEYEEMKHKFDKHIADQKLNVTEGNSGQAKVAAQYKFYHHLARQPWINTICETGFNGGHSAFQWLAASPSSTKLFSFDLCSHDYTLPMARYINQTFPGRFSLTCGDSTKTLPTVQGLDGRCDLLIVDGGHLYNITIADISNFQRLANRSRNMVVVDDIPILPQVVQAWNEAKTKGLVQHTLVCNLRWFGRGFAVGYYVF